MKVSKESVDYSEGKTERCGNCVFFVLPDNECTKVRGFIQARMWCKLHKYKQDAAKKAA